MGPKSIFRPDKDRRERGEQEREEQLALANRLSQIVLSSSSLAELCRDFAAELKELMPIDWAALALIEEDTSTVRLLALSAEISSTWGEGNAMPLWGSPVTWVAENQRALVEPDLTARSQFTTGESFIKQGIKSVVYMPLFSRREVFGSLIVGSRLPDAYRERELKLLKYTATQLAMAVENFTKRADVGLNADFLTALRHEMKTPLTPVIAGGDLLAQELVRLAQSIARSGRAMDTKLDWLLQLARVQAADFKLNRVSLEPGAVLEDAAARLTPQLEARGQALNLTLSSSLPRVKGDREYLSQALFMLLSIASELSPEGDKIEIEAKGVGSELVVAVRGCGAGFSKEEQRELLIPYSFAEADRQRFPELKLRLTIVRQLVQRHGGRLWLESEPGEGTTFGFSLPLARD